MYSIVIPSYNRLDGIQRYALQFIQKNALYLEAKVYVFVDPRSWEAYQILKKKFKFVDLIEGKQGLVNQRNAIRDYFPVGECLLIMDDDTRGVKLCKAILDEQINTGKATHEIIRDEIAATFGFMKNNKLTLCGVHPSNNTYYASGNLSYGLHFAVGCFYFEINSRHPMLYQGWYCQRYQDEMEDYIRTFKHWRLMSAVGRNDRLAVNHRYNAAKGGMNTGTVAARLMSRDRISLTIARDYPTYFRLKKKKHGKCEIQEARLRQSYHLFKSVHVSKPVGKNPGALPGMYYQPTDTWACLDTDKNYVIYDGLQIQAVVVRDVIEPRRWNPELLRAVSSWTKYINTNRGDIAGKLDLNKMKPYQVRALEKKGLTLETCKTNKAGTRIHEDGFNDSNYVNCITLGEYAKGKYSQYDKHFI
jgi:hypothetical protein